MHAHQDRRRHRRPPRPRPVAECVARPAGMSLCSPRRRAMCRIDRILTIGFMARSAVQLQHPRQQQEFCHGYFKRYVLGRGQPDGDGQFEIVRQQLGEQQQRRKRLPAASAAAVAARPGRSRRSVGVTNGTQIMPLKRDDASSRFSRFLIEHDPSGQAPGHAFRKTATHFALARPSESGSCSNVTRPAASITFPRR
jgi:hypothetical protein